ncbi:MAG TPA: EAL domain-containing protein [Terracidiphilus sp.]
MNLPENSDSSQQQEILDRLPVLIFLERAGRIVFANAEARVLLGMVESKWTPRPVEEVLWGLFPGTAEPQTLLTGSASGSPFHATMAVGGGRLVPVEGTYCIVNAELREAIIVAQPGGRERTPKPRLMEDVLASIPDAVAIVHDSHVLYTNAAFTHMFGYAADEVSGGNLRDFIVPETRLHENSMVEKAVEAYGRAALETVRVNKAGDFVDVAIRVGPLLVGGNKAGQVVTYRDIGDRKQVEAKLQHDAMHDVLTGLPNSALFQDRVTLALSRRKRRRDQGCGVLYLDLDNLEKIHQTLGHAAGDMLLVALAGRLSSELRPQDTAARIGGDEFAILVENILTASDLEVIANRVLCALQKPFEILGYPFVAEASIGAAMAGEEGTTSDSLLRDADLALYHAKQTGGRRYEIFDRNMVVQIDSLHERERELRQALSNRTFEFWYEPMYRLATGQLEGFESLRRWRRADGSIDVLNDLLPAAEETGLSVSIGRETLEGVCSQLRNWDELLPGNRLTLSVNFTPRQFYQENMVEELKRVLDSTGAEPSRLMIEVSETTVNDKPDCALIILQRVADCGVRVGMDDFGSGLAPLNHLVRLPLNVVKMDPLLTIAATKMGRQLALVESLIHLGKSAGVQLLAQGVETQEQLDALRRLGCELGQGQLLSKALEPAQALRIATEAHRSLPPLD